MSNNPFGALVVLRSDGITPWKRFAFEEPYCAIGTDPECDILVDRANVAEFHAFVQVRAVAGKKCKAVVHALNAEFPVVVVTDNGPSNKKTKLFRGSKLNLAKNHVFSVGGRKFRYEMPSASTAEKEAAVQPSPAKTTTSPQVKSEQTLEECDSERRIRKQNQSRRKSIMTLEMRDPEAFNMILEDEDDAVNTTPASSRAVLGEISNTVPARQVAASAKKENVQKVTSSPLDRSIDSWNEGGWTLDENDISAIVPRNVHSNVNNNSIAEILNPLKKISLTPERRSSPFARPERAAAAPSDDEPKAPPSIQESVIDEDEVEETPEVEEAPVEIAGSAVNEELETLRAQLAQLQTEKEKLREDAIAQKGALQLEVENLQAEKGNILSENSLMKEQIERVQTQCNELKAAHQDMSKKSEEAEERIRQKSIAQQIEAESAVKLEAKKSKELGKEVENLQKTVEILKRSQTDMSAAKERYEASIQSMMTKSVYEPSERMSKLLSDNNALKAELLTNSESFKDLHDRYSKLKGTALGMEAREKEHIEQIRSLRRAVQELEMSKMELVTKTEKKLQEAAHKVGETSTQCDKLETENGELKRLQPQLEQARKELSKTSEALKETKSKLERVEAEKSKAVGDLADASKERSRLEAEAQKINQKLAEIKVDANKMKELEAASAKHADEISAQNALMERLKEENQDLKAKAYDNMSNLHHLQAQLDAVAKQASGEAEDDSKVTELEDTIRGLREENNELNRLCEELIAQVEGTVA
mmetsp:Transcript_12606/g.31890  ORF Transcript_12606/g.31890 Transcript_12606/m.31890 type:complete len:764 (+) Transcript_12606:171-2462(+)